MNHSNFFVSYLQVWATVIGSHLKKEPTASPVLTKWWKLELTLATNFGSHAQMVTKFGGQILAPKFGFVPDCVVMTKFRCRVYMGPAFEQSISYQNVQMIISLNTDDGCNIT